MRLLAYLRNWSLMVKLPVTVVGIAILLAATLLVPVVHQISTSEIENLQTRVQSFLSVCADGMQPLLDRRDYWAAFDFLTRQHQSQADLRFQRVFVEDAEGRVFASTEPDRFRILSPVVREPRRQTHALPGWWDTLWRNEFVMGRRIMMDGLYLGYIEAAIELTPLRRRIASIVTTATLFSAAITALCAALGFLISREMIMPLRRLKGHVDQVAQGNIQFIDERSIYPNDELNQLMIQFNHMAAALLEKERIAEHLAMRDQLLALGKLAASMAHEINNPLGGMLNVVNTVRRHGDDRTVRDSSLELLERGMKQIQSIVQAALVTYRHDGGHLNLRPVDLEDIRLLIQSYVRSAAIDLHWRNDLVGEIQVPATAIRQLSLNLLINSCEAMPRGGELHFDAHAEADWLTIVVEDTGGGMPSELVSSLIEGDSPGMDAVSERGGLGLWICMVLIRELRGHWRIESEPQRGTRIEVVFPLKEIGEHAA